jgi:hypothetical protein
LVLASNCEHRRIENRPMLNGCGIKCGKFQFVFRHPGRK